MFPPFLSDDILEFYSNKEKNQEASKEKEE